MKLVILGTQMIASGSRKTVIAGEIESITSTTAY